jgi:hypothetical protein
MIESEAKDEQNELDLLLTKNQNDYNNFSIQKFNED